MKLNSIMSIITFAFVIVLVLRGFRASKFSRHNLKWFQVDYGTAPILGVLILVATFSIDHFVIIRGIIGSDGIEPYAILILFMTLVYVCISLDLTGFFEYLALRTVKAAGNSPRKLFLYFFFLSSFLTVFTSNDIVILTLTPIICYFAKYTKVDPIPYLIGQFFAANIWSLTLYIGNPTNIIVAEAYDLSFVEYTTWMLLPTIAAGFSCLLMVWLVFRKKLPQTFEPPEIDPSSALKDKFGAIFGVSLLASCLILLSLASWLNLTLWSITLSFAIIMFFRDIIYDFFSKKKSKGTRNYNTIRNAAVRMPWKILPFIIGMFILVEALATSGWVDLFAALISNISKNMITSVFLMVFLSAITSNLMNNQPMTILFTKILISSSFNAPGTIKFGIMFALIMGSNFGANFTLIGALAGIMWHKILLNKGIEISFKDFAKYGIVIMPIVIAVAALTLSIELLVWL